MRRALMLPVALLAGLSTVGDAALGPARSGPPPEEVAAVVRAPGRSDGPAPARRPRTAGELPGVVVGRDSIDVVAPLDGRLAAVRVRLGDRVRRGQLLCTLEPRAGRERRAPLASAREDEVRAPMDGVVAARYVERGARLIAGTPLVRLLGEGPLRVRFVAPAARRAELGPGSPVRIQLPELTAALTGVIERVALDASARAPTLIAEARLDVPEDIQGQVLAGRAAQVTPLGPVRPPVGQGTAATGR